MSQTEYQRQWYLSNKERIIAEHYLARLNETDEHTENRLTKARDYNSRNRDKISKQKKSYRIKHYDTEQNRERYQRYAEGHREQCRNPLTKEGERVNTNCPIHSLLSNGKQSNESTISDVPIADGTQNYSPKTTSYQLEKAEELHPKTLSRPVENVIVEKGTEKPALSLLSDSSSKIFFDDTYKGKRYTYGLQYRPLGYAQVPDGYIIFSNRPNFNFKFGTVDYPFKLSDEQLTQFQMVFYAELNDSGSVLTGLKKSMKEETEAAKVYQKVKVSR